jgi:hypothetical protein
MTEECIATRGWVNLHSRAHACTQGIGQLRAMRMTLVEFGTTLSHDLNTVGRY